MKKSFITIAFFLIAVIASAQPQGYYDAAQGKTGQVLRAALHGIIKGHTSVSYNQMLQHFPQTDAKPNGKVWDMYSDIPNGTPHYQYNFSDNCGNYSGEGDCYNREHLWPQSWFNEKTPMKSDFFHIVPTDGYVNGKRSNYAFGEVGNVEWSSTNGSKLGKCTYPGFNGTVFEPIDEYKGDIARSMFYMTVRYYGEDSGWDSSDMTNKCTIKQWALNMLLEWHRSDPVSQKEIDRNEAVYDIQHNRNPFIDNPEFAEMIWNPSWGLEDETVSSEINIYPNPAASYFNVEGSDIQMIKVYGLNGTLVTAVQVAQCDTMTSINVENLKNGLYLVSVIKVDGSVVTRQVIVKQ